MELEVCPPGYMIGGGGNRSLSPNVYLFILSGGQFVVGVVQKKITMGNSVKTDKEIQLDLGLVGSLSKVGLLGPQIT